MMLIGGLLHLKPQLLSTCCLVSLCLVTFSITEMDDMIFLMAITWKVCVVKHFWCYKPLYLLKKYSYLPTAFKNNINLLRAQHHTFSTCISAVKYELLQNSFQVKWNTNFITSSNGWKLFYFKFDHMLDPIS